MVTRANTTYMECHTLPTPGGEVTDWVTVQGPAPNLVVTSEVAFGYSNAATPQLTLIEPTDLTTQSVGWLTVSFNWTAYVGEASISTVTGYNATAKEAWFQVVGDAAGNAL